MTKLETLRKENAELRARLADTEKALRALASGEVDSVATEVGAPPTLLRAAQEKLRENEQLFRSVFERASDSLILFKDAGVYVDVNPATCELFGRSREELVGHIGERHYVDIDAAAAREKLLARGTDRGELTLRRPNGELRVAEYTATTNITPGLHLALFRDVTEQRAADERRRHLAAIVESSDEAIIGTDAKGTITSWNHSAERLFQWSEQEAIGRSTTILIPPERLEEAIPRIERVLRGEVVRVETMHIRKDRSRVPTMLTASPVFDAAGRVVGASKVVRDVSEARKAAEKLKEAEERLRHAQKMEAIGVLAGGVAHDFNNVLSVILSFSSLVLDDLKPDDPIRGDIEEVQRAGERATNLTRQLLAFSRKQIIEPQVLDLGQAVVRMEKMLRRLLSEAIELSLDVPSSLGRVMADPGQVEQIVMNLAVNGRDAMQAGGKLSIAVANTTLDAEYATLHDGVRPGRYVMLTVTDTGTGMDAATRARIFEPFFTTKEVGRGTGLGLSTVFGIVKQSHGHISVSSEPGHGTTFKVYLPRVDQAVTGLSLPAPGTQTLRGKETVLVVDDEEQIRAATRAILQRNGYHVLEAASGGDALVICEQFPNPIHLLLTDVVMPRLSGRQVADRLSPMRPEMKVLYVSGYTQDAIVHHGVLDAGIAFLQKPITPSGLLRKMREVLDG